MKSEQDLRTERFPGRLDDEVVERLDMSCGGLGFAPPPPVPVSIQFLESRGHWFLYTRFAPGEAPAIERWLDLWNPDDVQIAPGIYPRVIRARFEHLPSRWEWIRSGSGVRLVSLVPQGNATLLFMGGRKEVTRFMGSIQEPVAMKIRVRAHTQRPGELVHLTSKQKEALSLAITFGYYEVPHRIDLRSLSRKLDRSLASVSSLLRRAEAKVLTHYVTDALVSEWEEHDPPSKASVTHMEIA